MTILDVTPFNSIGHAFNFDKFFFLNHFSISMDEKSSFSMTNQPPLIYCVIASHCVENLKGKKIQYSMKYPNNRSKSKREKKIKFIIKL